jgi:hypothetical protein
MHEGICAAPKKQRKTWDEGKQRVENTEFAQFKDHRSQVRSARMSANHRALRRDGVCRPHPSPQNLTSLSCFAPFHQVVGLNCCATTQTPPHIREERLLGNRWRTERDRFRHIIEDGQKYIEEKKEKILSELEGQLSRQQKMETANASAPSYMKGKKPVASTGTTTAMTRLVTTFAWWTVARVLLLPCV